MSETSSVRRLGWGLLVALGTVALGLAVVPGAASSLPVEALVEALGNDYFLLGLFGGVALAVLAWMVGRRATGSVTQADPPDPETILDAPRPGEGFDALLGTTIPRHRDSGETADALRERLRTAAVRAEMRDGRSRERAEERVADGRWTDDPVAGQFLSDDPSSPALGERARLWLLGDSWVQHGARATARELTRQTETERPGEGERRPTRAEPSGGEANGGEMR
ncbi:DUF7269 family protein [Haloarcula nitratireducens]|uniref:Uncharacterized protein n=1 Tax=Haloarcula nitratireducens TaxID=2487749 RepID=A0AAW4PBM2_9EURY|nr:hypothetical protein [Halomicroarcula nitratireducens]MBX0294988.1 hypothetical protein [Halomicroarcula nitratireducens]